jgi:osmotically-inducible protein OsmY
MIKTNEQLQRDILDELTWDPRLGAAEIGVAVKDGVVTLSGQVDSFAKKNAAVRAAERVAGVCAIAEELVVEIPGSLIRTDADIAHAALDALFWHTEVPNSLKVLVDGGWLTLEGEVDWQYQKAAAEDAVHHLTGVTGVTNRVSIRKRASIPDVKQRIESALKRHAELDAHQIRVEATDGKVFLRGSVRSWAEREDAELAAWSAPGVTAVQDELSVYI